MALPVSLLYCQSHHHHYSPVNDQCWHTRFFKGQQFDGHKSDILDSIPDGDLHRGNIEYLVHGDEIPILLSRKGSNHTVVIFW